jgi:hypothetical protein
MAASGSVQPRYGRRAAPSALLLACFVLGCACASSTVPDALVLCAAAGASLEDRADLFEVLFVPSPTGRGEDARSGIDRVEADPLFGAVIAEVEDISVDEYERLLAQIESALPERAWLASDREECGVTPIGRRLPG